MRSSKVSTRNFSSSSSSSAHDESWMPASASAGATCSRNAGLHAGQQHVEPVADLDQLLGRGAPVGAGAADAGGHLVLQAGDPHLEELVEVLAEDRQELGPLEQRDAVVLGQRQDALVEVEPGQLAVAVPLRGASAAARPRRGSALGAVVVE